MMPTGPCHAKQACIGMTGSSFVGILLLLTVALCAMLILAAGAQAQTGTGPIVAQPALSARKIFLMLFLMLGPIKILVPFVNMTRGSDAKFQRQLATRAVLFSAAALVLAGLLGVNVLENFNISVWVLALTGGLVLFLVALQTVLQQGAVPARPRPDDPPPGLQLAYTPLAFPTIVTPYGIAAVVVLVAFSQTLEGRLTIGAVVVAIMVLNLIVMLAARRLMTVLALVLPILGAVLGVVQVALGLQIINNALQMLGVL